MKSLIRLLIFGTLFAAAPALAAYDTGSMTCDHIGLMAKSVVEGKQKGMNLSDALAVGRRARRMAEGFEAEHQAIEDIVVQIYTADFAKGYSPDGAYKIGCQVQKKTP